MKIDRRRIRLFRNKAVVPIPASIQIINTDRPIGNADDLKDTHAILMEFEMSMFLRIQMLETRISQTPRKERK